eukprot:121335-Pelagomonas_calceolata.AAC.4
MPSLEAHVWMYACLVPGQSWTLSSPKDYLHSAPKPDLTPAGSSVTLKGRQTPTCSSLGMPGIERTSPGPSELNSKLKQMSVSKKQQK